MPATIKLPNKHSLERGGALLHGPDGVRVKVLLHDPSDLATRTLKERRHFLLNEFSVLRGADDLNEVEIDLRRISVLGQSVSAIIPLRRWVTSVAQLQRRGLEVIPRLRRKAIYTAFVPGFKKRRNAAGG